MLSDRCLSVCRSSCPVCPVLPVTLVYCGQTVGRIKMKLGTQVGLGTGHIVSDGDPCSSLSPRAPNFRPISVVAKWLDGSRFKMPLGMEEELGPGDFVLEGNPALPFAKKGAEPLSPIFGRPCPLWPNGWMHQLRHSVWR